jgi:hypothetical protein
MGTNPAVEAMAALGTSLLSLSLSLSRSLSLSLSLSITVRRRSLYHPFLSSLHQRNQTLILAHVLVPVAAVSSLHYDAQNFEEPFCCMVLSTFLLEIVNYS